MNLRILKKLSKRVAPMVAPIVNNPEAIFKADAGENYTSTGRHDRKHWERSRSVHNDLLNKKDIKSKASDGGGYILLSQQYISPWKNTDMIGWMSGYEEPEWEEETLWDYFRNHVFFQVASYEPIPNTKDEYGIPDHKWVVSKKLNNPRDYLKVFQELKETQQ